MSLPLSQASAQELSALRPSCLLGGYRFTLLRWGATLHKTDAQPRHHHAFCEIVLLHRGRIYSESEEVIQTAVAPAILINMPGQRHAHGQKNTVAMDWFGVSIAREHNAAVDGLEELVEAWLLQRQSVCNKTADCCATPALLDEEIQQRGAGWRRSCTWIMQRLLLQVIRHSVSTLPAETAQALELEASLRSAIRTRPAHDWSVAELAALAGVSERQLNRLLRQRADCTALELISSERMELAQSLLLTEDKTVEAVAAALGYLDKRYFARLFKKYSGVSPQQWRQQAEQYRVEEQD